MRYGVHKIWPRQPAVTLTFDLQNLIRSSVETSEYSLSVISKLFKPFMRYHGNNTWQDKWRTNEWTNGTTGQPKINIMPSLKLLVGESIINGDDGCGHPKSVVLLWGSMAAWAESGMNSCNCHDNGINTDSGSIIIIVIIMITLLLPLTVFASHATPTGS